MQDYSQIVPILILIPKMIIALFWKNEKLSQTYLYIEKRQDIRTNKDYLKKVWGPFLTVNLDYSVSNGKSSFLSALFVCF